MVREKLKNIQLMRGGVAAIIAAALLGAVLILSILYFYGKRHHDIARDMLVQQAVSHYNSMVILRRWAAEHGGVFVKPTDDKLKPNPYLKNNTLKSAKGDTLIKVNPAWMTRQYAELSNQFNDHYIKITSLNPINPNNAADKFEKKGLKVLHENREQKFYYELSPRSEGSLHFIGGLVTERSCLQCHGKHYRLGEIRGGLRITIPAKLYWDEIDTILTTTTIIAIFVILGITIFVAILIFYLKSIDRSQREVKQLNKTLEARVGERTKQIEELYDNEKYLRSIMTTVSNVNKQLVVCKEEDELIQNASNIIAAHRDYQLAWIGFVEGMDVVVKAKSEDPTNYISKSFYTCIDPESPYAQGPTGTSIRENRTVVINDTQSDPRFLPWKERALASNLMASISIPLRDPGTFKPFGALNVYSSRLAGFKPEEIGMLEELSSDLSFAIRFSEKEKMISTLRSQEIKNYENTISSFVNMIELRDRYTAGHSVRVSNYCRLIAEEMGLPEDVIRKLEHAAFLHDIGKIITPDTVLLNPGKLSDIEYELIKQHVECGYEFLSNIDSYTELAEIIKHHHEHYDGSGYPQGISGERIPLISGIITVADAFDAMTTNRIYRLRMTVEEALKEIEEESGRQFNPIVAGHALKALKKIATPEGISQLPESTIEKMRFSYFFNDKLTGAFNEDYLRAVIKANITQHEFSSLHIVYLREFSRYNVHFGWEEGNLVLKSLAQFLQNYFPKSMIFRIYGDTFAVLSKEFKLLNTAHFRSIDLFHKRKIKTEVRYLNLEKSDYTWPDFFSE